MMRALLGSLVSSTDNQQQRKRHTNMRTSVVHAIFAAIAISLVPDTPAYPAYLVPQSHSEA